MEVLESTKITDNGNKTSDKKRASNKTENMILLIYATSQKKAENMYICTYFILLFSLIPV